MKTTKKMIKILQRGPIYPKGGISGPILTPYMEDVRTIFIMITRGIKVVEVLSDGTEVVLNTMNFDSVISVEQPVAVTEPVVVITPPVPPVLEIEPVIPVDVKPGKKIIPDTITKK